MTLPAAQLAYFRAQWELRMTDSALIRRITGRTLNTNSGVDAPAYTTQYTGKALYRPAGEKASEFGERMVTVRTGTLFVPHSTTAPKVGDLATLTSVTDAALTNTVHAIRAIRKDTYLTVRAYEVEEVQDA